MKKLFNLLLLTLAVTVILYNLGCSSDEQSFDRINPTPEITIVGVWEFGDIINPCNKRHSIEFLENYGFVENHVNSFCIVEEYEDNYILLDNQVTYYGTTKTILELTLNKLVLAYPDNTVKTFYKKH